MARGSSTRVGIGSEVPAGVRIVDDITLELREIGTSPNLQAKRFSVDKAFGEHATSSEVFASVRSLARAAASGGSAAIVAYGPSGSGKTHTMYGTITDQGIIPRTAAELLSAAAAAAAQRGAMGAGGSSAACAGVRVSLLELHNETLIDLLVPRGQPAPTLEVRGGSGGSMATIEGAREVAGQSLAGLLATIKGGLARRQVAATNSNATSSRSHVIVVFRVGSLGQLMLVDLAGLERVKRSGVEGSQLRETQSINRSLTSLTDVVDALRRGSAHVPVRNSRLARLMAGALGGGADTAVIVCVPPGAERCDEALTALCFAERVRRIPAAGAATASAPPAIARDTAGGPLSSAQCSR